ncbi:hypothetical protein [Pseudarthrobacter sp. NPDC058119]|uniref:hypothetical protein n=1 Tax=Pseudarthrobacter sp. NPDC058119 TaxID=3346348 RepID=UPI0036DDCB3A
MVIREPMRMRKAVLAGAVAVALTGTGAALAWSATGTPTPTPSPSQSAPGDSGNAPGLNKPGKAQRALPLHGEGVVKNPDGTFQTKLEQRGTVESVSDSAITVKSEDGFSQTYAVNGDTKITKIPPAANPGATPSPGAVPSPGATPGGGKPDDGKRLEPADGTIADIAAGDAVRIAGVKDGDKATAKRIVKGAGDGPALGLGRGLEHAPGLKHAPGLGHGKGVGRGNSNDDQGA